MENNNPYLVELYNLKTYFPIKAGIIKRTVGYVKAVDGLTMQQVKKVQKPMLVAMAVYIGKTRLIDNTIWD